MYKNNVKKHVNKLIAVISVLCCFLCNVKSICAAEAVNSDYFSKFYSGKYEVVATDKNNNDVTDNFLKKTQILYANKEIDIIKRIVMEEEITLRIIVRTPLLIENTPRALEQSKTVVSEYLYANLRDTYNVSSMEVQAELRGTFYYNPQTYKITRAINPTYRVLEMTTSISGAVSNICPIK